MTDLQKFIKLYNSLDISLNIQNNDEMITLYLGDHEFGQSSTKIKGYNGFYSTIDFTKDGKFIQQGFWEQIKVFNIIEKTFRNECLFFVLIIDIFWLFIFIIKYSKKLYNKEFKGYFNK